MKKINWPLTVLFVWLFLFLFAAIISHLEPRFCNTEMLEGISKRQDVFVFSCWEFWANRYQSLAGSLIAAGVAGLTLRALLRQLQTNNRQAAVTSAQALRHRITELSDEKAAISDPRLKLKPFLFEIMFDDTNETIDQRDVERVIKYIPDAERAVEYWGDISMACLETEPPAYRKRLYDEILKLVIGAGQDFTQLRAEIEGYDPFDDGKKISSASLAAADRLTEIQNIGRKIRTDVYHDTFETWKAIRKFEKAAVS